MAADITERVLAHPLYRPFTRRSNRIRLVFFVLMAVIYFGFMLILAFWSNLLAAPVAPGATLTIGVLIALLVELSAIVMVGAYVYVCSKRVDPLLAQILGDVT